jgi:hypothetical protein
MLRNLLLIPFAVLAGHSFSEAYSVPVNQKTFAVSCVKQILDGNYTEAIRLADSAESSDKADPLAPIFRLAAIGVRDVDLDTLLDSAGFFHTYEISVGRIALYEKQNGVSSYSKMLLGFSKGLHASFYLRFESYFAAMQTGFDALKLLDDAYKLDTGNTDALLFTGLYDYARGELKKKLWWVLFWYPGSKENGIARLRQCGDHGTLTSTAARLALADIFIRDKRPSECLSVINRLEKDSPGSRFVLWAKVKYLESCSLYDEAARAYGQLSSSYASVIPYGNYSELVTRSRQAQMLFLAGRKEEAAALCRNILPEARGLRNKLIYKDTDKLLRRIHGGEN